MNEAQRQKIADGPGFLAALDQSGGSTPAALALYGVPESADATEDEMFDLMHGFRSAFGGDRILGAILFEQTVNRRLSGMATAQYLWERKNVVPFVKVDEGTRGRGRRRAAHEAVHQA